MKMEVHFLALAYIELAFLFSHGQRVLTTLLSPVSILFAEILEQGNAIVRAGMRRARRGSLSKGGAASLASHGCLTSTFV